MVQTRRLTREKFVKSTKSLGSVASYPAMMMVQNKQKFYLATIPVEDIFPFAFVTRRQEDPVLGFQRSLSEHRAVDISRYLDKSYGSIPTNIVLSAQGGAKFIYNSKSKLIKYKRLPKSFLVIDGQHRLYGYGLTKKNHRVPVAIYEGLSRKEEATLFIDINTNQKGVPAALLLDIKQVAEKETEIEASLRNLFDKLAKESKSPLCGYLSPSVSRRGMISRVTFNRSVKPILENVVMTKLPENKQYELLSNFFIALEETLENSGLLLKSAYFEAFCALFDDVLRLSYTKHRDYKYNSLLDVLSPLENIDITGILTAGKTKITKAAILPHLKNAISNQLEVYEDMV
jgi:DNA sulfur modification protein DndB